MQIANCQVFTLLVVVGLLMFFSSFLTLDLHTSVEELKKLPGHEFFHAPRVRSSSFLDATHNLQDFKKEESIAAALSNRFNEGLHQAAAGHLVTDQNSPAQTQDNLANKQCSVTFQPKCRINPLVKYWDEVMECYTSPLRKFHGLSAPKEKQKFVVFQPDAGGWNNIRMALEVVILFAQVTGRILVLPPNAVLYLLHMNKKWGDNKSGMEDYFDFDKLRAAKGLETMPMSTFLKEFATVEAGTGKGPLLYKPVPNNDINLIRQPLWDYLATACYTQSWSPGKLYVGFNITTLTDGQDLPDSVDPDSLIGTFESTDPARLDAFSLKKKRELQPYNTSMHAHRAIFFPGTEPNRLLTHFYSMLFFATPKEEHRAKRFMRDRLRYHDQIFCTASEIVEKLLRLQSLLLTRQSSSTAEGGAGRVWKKGVVDPSVAAEILQLVESQPLHMPSPSGDNKNVNPVPATAFAAGDEEDVRSGRVVPQYVAFHIRRGDFQQKHTRLPAEEIVALTNHLVQDRHKKVAYISTDEGNRSFFEPFVREYGAVYFLGDLKNGTDVDRINQNYVGMIEQVVCAAADVFIGTPLSTFTAYITRMRGFMNRTITHLPTSTSTGTAKTNKDHTVSVRRSVREPAALIDRSGLYDRTYYFMKHHMYQLHTKPHVHFPLWIRDFVDAFEDIDDDSST